MESKELRQALGTVGAPTAGPTEATATAAGNSVRLDPHTVQSGTVRADGVISSPKVKPQDTVLTKTSSTLRVSAVRPIAGISSGNHIRRRPPSVPERATSPHFATPTMSTLWRDLVEHRTDPSPAPRCSRKRRSTASATAPLARIPSAVLRASVEPPRGKPSGQTLEELGRTRSLRRIANERKRGPLLSLHAANATHGPQGLLSPVKGSLGTARPPIVLDAKQGPRFRSVRSRLQEVPSMNDDTRQEVVQCYRKLCEQVGQAPQESWITAVLGERPDLPSDSSVQMPVGGRSATSDCGCASGRNTDRTMKRMMSNTILSAKSQLSAEGRQKVKGASKTQGYSTLKPPSIASAAKFTKLVSRGSISRDDSLRHMMAYCDHLRPYSIKMDQLRQRRQEVQESLNRFLQTCSRGHETPQRGDSRCAAQVREVSDPKSLAISALQTQADSLTSGLKELQRCNVRLLLCLSNLSCEVRRPLGSVSGGTGLIHNEQQHAFDSYCAAPMPQIQNIPKPSGPLSSVSAPSGPPTAYLNFLRMQESVIVQELSNLCTRVRTALEEGVNVSMADEGLLETPLFLPSTWSTSACSARVAENPKLSNPKPHSKARNLSAASRRVHHSSSAPAGKPLTRFASCAKGSENNGSARRCTDSQRTVDSSTTTPMSEVHLPFVGVAFSNWASASDEEKGGKLDDSSCQGDEARHRSPWLVIGGGKRRLTLDAATEKHLRPSPSANGASASTFCRAKSSATVVATSKKLAARHHAGNASPTRTAKRSKVKHTKRNGVLDTEGLVTAAQIKQAEATWATIRGLALRTCASEELGSPTQPSSVTPFVIPPSTVNGERASTDAQAPEQTWKRADTASSLEDTNPSQQSTPSTARDQILVPIEDGDTPVLPGSQVRSASGESRRREVATQIIARFLCRVIQKQSERSREQMGREPVSTAEQGVEERATRPTAVPSDREIWRSSEVGHRMATRIAHAWRYYRSYKEVKHLREQHQEEEQRQQLQQYRNVMAARIQSFLVVNLAVQHRRRLLQQRQEEIKKTAAANAVSEKPVKVTTPNAKQHKESNASPGSAMRERFDRTREKRKSLLRDHHDRADPGSVASGSSPKVTTPGPARGNKTRAQSVATTTKNQVSSRGTPVPPLHLKSSGLSTHSVENYHPDSVTLKVGFLHRLLRAPKPLVYALRVMCGRYESRPNSAYDTLASCDWRAARDDVGNGAELSDHDKDKGEAVEEMAETASILSGSTSVELCDREMVANTRGLDEMDLEIKSCRAVYDSHSRKDRQNARDDSVDPFPSLPQTWAAHPLSMRMDSVVDSDELRFLEPIPKCFPRPFEHWSIALSLQQRIFTAAAMYAWKLIFSHTPHDDYKQRMLDTRDEQEARLERVEQRNRMILACYCVRSESEWLREASSDLNFVGRIWNPKRSLDPNDPDFERHCLETYEFVENFLYQCFPTLSTLEDVPTFLMGAGVYFMLRATLAKLGAGEGADLMMNVDLSDKSVSLLNAQQRESLFVYDLLNLIDTLTFWYGQPKEKGSDAPKKGKMGGKQVTAAAVVTDNGDDGFVSWRARLERSVKSILGGTSAAGAAPPSPDPLARLNRDVGGPTHCSPLRLVRCSSCSIVTSEEVDEDRFLLAYPADFLTGLSERLLACLAGVKLDLDVCEDLDVTV